MGRASASTWVTLVVAAGCHSTPLCVSRACRPAHCGRSRTGEPKTQECLPCSRSGGLSGCPLTPSNSYNRRTDLPTTSAYGRRRRSRQSRRKFPRLDPSPPARPGAEPALDADPAGPRQRTWSPGRRRVARMSRTRHGLQAAGDHAATSAAAPRVGPPSQAEYRRDEGNEARPLVSVKMLPMPILNPRGTVESPRRPSRRPASDARARWMPGSTKLLANSLTSSFV